MRIKQSERKNIATSSKMRKDSGLEYSLKKGLPCSENILNDLWECSFIRMSGIQRFLDFKDGESDEEMQRQGRQKK